MLKNAIICVVLVVIIICLAIYFFFYTQLNAYIIMKKLNDLIKPERDRQNRKFKLMDANDSQLTSVKILHSQIKLNHDQILKEVKELMAKGYEGLPMAEIDNVQKSFVNGSKNWSPIWVKFIDCWAGTSKHLPTLKRIVKKAGDDVLLLHVSVFKPHTFLPEHRGISYGVLRYHYGLDIPEGDVGLQLEDTKYSWTNREGFLWDDTLNHSAWNNTDNYRLVIFADIHRPLPWHKRIISRRFHKLIQNTKHVNEIQERLRKEGRHID
jgi:beta-hydroxylase